MINLRISSNRSESRAFWPFVIACISILFSAINVQGQVFTKIDTGIIVNDGGDSENCSWSNFDSDGNINDCFGNSPN